MSDLLASDKHVLYLSDDDDSITEKSHVSDCLETRGKLQTSRFRTVLERRTPCFGRVALCFGRVAICFLLVAAFASAILFAVRQECQLRRVNRDIEELKLTVAKQSAQIQESQKLQNGQRCKRSGGQDGSQGSPTTVSSTAAATTTESDHVRHKHHGIHNSNIALLTGNGSKLEDYVTSDYRHANDLAFIQRSVPPRISSFCPVLYRNKRGHGCFWCSHIGEVKQMGAESMFCVTDEMQNFDYFQEPSWMHKKLSKENYEIMPGGKFQVKKTGMYIVFANILFGNEVSDAVAYRIHVHKQEDQSEHSIGRCIHSLPTNKEDAELGLTPCSVMVVTRLSAGDEVFLRIKGFIFFRVSPDTLQFGMIKLSDTD